jgi:hypothetical protein
MGPAGPVGAPGIAGGEGAQGATLVGPMGATGAPGSAGAQGVGGAAGEGGYASAGGIGAAGPAGDVGAQGPSGPIGMQGPVGALSRWTSYRDFTFPYDQTNVPLAQMSTVSEIASYMAQNPSLRLGIDGSGNQNLSDPRADSVRDALINAGVPPAKIQLGAFGDPKLARDRRVLVMLSSSGA